MVYFILGITVIWIVLSFALESGTLIYMLLAILSWAFVKWTMKFKLPVWLLALALVALPVTAWMLAHVFSGFAEWLSYYLSAY